MAKLEYKYLVPREHLDTLRSEIKPFVKLDRYAVDREPHEYTVKSIYFDTPALSCYYKKIEGIKIRQKYRVRGYNNLKENDIVFLEIKKKHNNYISKIRAPLYNHNLRNLFNSSDVDKFIICDNGNQNSRIDAKRFFYHYHRKRLNPVIMIAYEREAYEGVFNYALRLTFDKNLRSNLLYSNNGSFKFRHSDYAMRYNIIMEVKFNGTIPSWVRQIVKNFNLTRLALSKYTICLNSYKRKRLLPKNVISNNYGVSFP